MEVEVARAKSARSPQRGSEYGGGAFPTRAPTLLTGYHTSPGGRLVDQSVWLNYRCQEGLDTAVTVRAMEEDQMSPETMVVTVVGAGGKMGMRISANLVPSLSPETIVLTLDPAAAYAGVLATRSDVYLAVAHPCHPSIFLERKTDAEWADTFGGVAAPQDVVAALESGDEKTRARAESIIRTIYGPVLNVHWVTVKQLAVLEPTLVETVTCMISGLLNEALSETVNSLGVPEPAARAILLGHAQVALTNSLRGSNPFSEACLIAMDYGRRTVIKDDWKKIFDDAELDDLIARMLHIDSVRRGPSVEATEAVKTTEAVEAIEALKTP
jgi:hypothetical protein